MARGRYYLIAVKRNQLSLYEAIELAFTPINQEEVLFWQHQTYIIHDKQHGCLESEL